MRIEALPGAIAEQPDTDFLSGFDIILLPQAPLSMQLAYDKACTEVNVAFFTAYSRGTVAYFFENLHVHEHTPMVGISALLRLPKLDKPILSDGRRHGNQPCFGIPHDACGIMTLHRSTVKITCQQVVELMTREVTDICTAFRYNDLTWSL